MENSKSNGDFTDGLTPDIIEEYLKGTLSPETRQQVDRYLQENPFEAEAMDGFKSYSVDLKRELTDLNQRLSAEMFSESRKSSRYLWPAAAAVSLLVASVLVIFLLLPDKQESAPIAINQGASEVRDEGQADQEIAPAPAPQSSEDVTVISSEDLESAPIIVEDELEVDLIEPKDVSYLEESVVEETVLEDILLNEAPTLEQSSAITSRAKPNKTAAGTVAARTGQMVSPRAQAPDNWNEYLINSLQFPREAQKVGVEGSVKIRFQVDVEGNPIHLELINGLGYGCDREALRVLQEGPPWKPGQINGVPVISEAEVEINFQSKKNH
jgi:TonB family protein